MARQKTSPLEDLILVTSKLPWWVGALLALVSYLVLHVIASRPLTPVTAPGQMGDMVVKGMATTLAMFGQYILPFALGIAALVSGVNLIRQKKLRIYGVRVDFLLFAATFFPHPLQDICLRQSFDHWKRESAEWGPVP